MNSKFPYFSRNKSADKIAAGAELIQESTEVAIVEQQQSAVVRLDQMPNVGEIKTDIMASLIANPLNLFSYFDGEKFPGGFGPTNIYQIDYWTLRARSNQLFMDNLYAQGIVKRLVTNEINTGLQLESTPNGDLLDLDDDFVNDWSEEVENRFSVWADNRDLCDFLQADVFGSIQETVRMTSIISGDVLVILRVNSKTGLPAIQLIDGKNVQTPLGAIAQAGNRICNGVELDSNNRQVAYWVNQLDMKSKRIPAFGEKSGRRLAWLVYGTKKRIDDVRGMPLLAIVLQSLKEIDRYRDSEQRAAVVNSFLAVWMKKTENKISTMPFSQAAVRKDQIHTVDNNGTTRDYKMGQQLPGIIMEELQQGEEPVSFDTRRPNVNFGVFEQSIVSAMAWAIEMPPEILQLSFENNYSASRAAINEWKMYLDKAREFFANQFNKLIYEEWFISEILLNKITADGFFESWGNPDQYDIYGSWISSDWAGAIKPSVDMLKEVNAYSAMVEEGFITRDRATKELTGMKYSKVIKRLKKENEQLAEAREPIAEPAALPPGRVPGQNKMPMDAEDETDSQDARRQSAQKGANISRRSVAAIADAVIEAIQKET